jgi:hypothetical protein
MAKPWPLLPNKFMQTFTIVVVHHEDPRPDSVLTASIWIAPGDRRADMAEEIPNEERGWFRMSGPIDISIATNICSSIESFFSQNGLRVIKDVIAD